MAKRTSISSNGFSGPEQGGDLSALYGAPLRRYFIRQGCAAQDVDDLVQEVFFRLVRVGDMDAVDNPSGYVFKIAANLLKDNARKRRTRFEDLHSPYDDVQHGKEEISPERLLLGKDNLAQLRSVILAMPEKTKTVFLLHRFENLKYREIAGVMNISVSAVEKHMMKALQKIAKFKGRL